MSIRPTLLQGTSKSTSRNSRCREIRLRTKWKISRTNYQELVMSYHRTPEHRRLRAALIRRWKPWEKSAGPKSRKGKAKVSRNAFKGGWRDQMRAVLKAL